MRILWLAVLLASLLYAQQANRLVFENSPYLRQHAHNPVDWYPWGDAAFEKAKRENKPIFLSIGYSTCHWCHVMEEESFENNATAAILNERFVSIKVDRERRPDLDEIYMQALLVMNGEGGWPLNLFLTPEGKPFFGGTYFPNPQFNQLLEKVAAIWKERRDVLETEAERLHSVLEQLMNANAAAKTINEATLERAEAQILAGFDAAYGGFGSAPKFPKENWLLYLLARGDASALDAVETTLTEMANGGIYDRLGGGFHRYATDAAWKIPHFEKMLYNQALLIRVYAEAYAATGKQRYRDVAAASAEYLLREMRTNKGVFYAATDADSEGKEGTYFVWTKAEIDKLLNPEERTMATALFNLQNQGPFEGKNILAMTQSVKDYAREQKISSALAQVRFKHLRQKLYTARSQRTPPHRDEKIITAWNALTVDALAEASALLNEPRYLDAALAAAEALWKSHRQSNGRLWRSTFEKNPSGDGVLNDYAFFALACLRLYDLSADALWLERAEALAKTMNERFYDSAKGGYYMNEPSAHVALRPKESADGAIISGNAAALQLLGRLLRRTGNPDYEKRYDTTLAAFSSNIERNPAAYASMLIAVNETLHGERNGIGYAARGNVRAELTWQRKTLAIVKLAVKKPWHINASKPLQPELQPTTLDMEGKAWQRIGIRYPEATIRNLDIFKEPLALYEGDNEIVIFVQNLLPGKPLQLNLSLQACSNTTCLAPERIRLEIPASPSYRILPSNQP